ncbi:LEPR-XLL domain-containing protein [Endozoicomonas acroporae]|uniref:LEPR-XLL domain-containing protein n=1 Tax=Endozoicomonas acroporae TaxID=1701104 RepID=UPI003D78D3F6
MDKQTHNSKSYPSDIAASARKGLFPKLNRLFEKMFRQERLQERRKRLEDFFTLEQLEPRLLLSADPIAALQDNALQLEQDAKVTLQVVINETDQQQYLRLVDENKTVLGQKKISDIAAGSTITVTGSEGADSFTIDQSFLDLGEQSFVLQFDGRGGHDTVAAGDDVTDSAWQINGANEGSMGANGIVEFLDVEALQTNQKNQAEASRHVLAAINDDYHWLMDKDEDGKGVLSTLEGVEGSITQTPSNTKITFSGFDILGGSGSDYLDYSQRETGVDVNLDLETAAGFDGITGFNTVIGSQASDTLTGDGNDNLFIVGAGDKVEGNGGFDTVLFDQVDGDLKLNASTKGDAGDAVNVFEYETGTWANDGSDWSFTSSGKLEAKDVDLLAARGDDSNNRFDFSAATVDVYLDGGSGDDTLIGGSKNDLLIGGAGADQITGGDGYDQLIEVRAADFTLENNTLTIGNDGLDTLEGIESVYLKAISKAGDVSGYRLDARDAKHEADLDPTHADYDAAAHREYDITLVGTELDDELYASSYGDTLSGLGGADTITGGSGQDTLEEDFAGRASISDASGSYELDLAQGASEVWVFDIPAGKTSTGFTLSISTSDGTFNTDTIAWDADGWDIVRSIEKALNIPFGQIAVSKTVDGKWQLEFTGLYAGTGIASSISDSESANIVSITTNGNKSVDTLNSFDSNDTLKLSGSELVDHVDLSAFAGKSEITTFSGNDIITGAQGINIINAGKGNDSIFVTSISADSIDGGEGYDTIVADVSNVADAASGYTLDLDNSQLMLGATILSHQGFESSALVGGAGNDMLNAHGFYGVSASTSLDSIAGWNALSEHTLRLSLEDGSTILDIDVSSSSTLQELIDLINAADDRGSDNPLISFDQASAELTFNGLSTLGVAGTDTSILMVLGFTSGTSGAVIKGMSLRLLASLQLTSQKGNGGQDKYTGSKGTDFFIIDSIDLKVDGKDGRDILSAETTSLYTTLVIEDDKLTWSGQDVDPTDSTQTIDVSSSVTIGNLEAAELLAIDGAELLDGSSASLDLVLDAATSTATLKGSSGDNAIRLSVDGRSDEATDKVTVELIDNTNSNEVVFYGSSADFTVSDFGWATITSGNYVAVKESSGDLTINSDLIWTGGDLKFRALNGKIAVNGSIQTDNSSSTDRAGNITFAARIVEINNNVTTVGQNMESSGDITIEAIDGRNLVYGSLEQGAASILAALPVYYNVDLQSATVTIGDVTIQGKDINILARAESNPDRDMNNDDGVFGENIPIIDDLANEVEDFKLIAGVSRSDVTSKITISSGATLKGDNITIHANSIARVNASPISMGLAVAVGVLDTDAVIDIQGTLDAEGNISITGQADNYLNIAAEPLFGLKGFAGSVAVGVLNSNSQVILNSGSRITAGGNLTVKAATVDYSLVSAESEAGNSGKAAASVAVQVESGHTEAVLAGNVLVKGDVIVEAVQQQAELNPTSSEAIVDRVPSFLDKYEDTAKQKVAFNKKVPLGKWLQKKVKPSDRLKPTKATVGIAFVYAEDSNQVHAYLGQESADSDINAGGSLDLMATAESRLLTATSSTSSTPSQLSQVEGTAGTDTSSGKFKQVPFGAAVSVTIASLDNNAQAQVRGNTELDALGAINVNATAQNLTGLIALDTTIKYVKPKLVDKSEIGGNYKINNGDLIRFDDSKYQWDDTGTPPEIDYFGAVYKFKGPNGSSLTLATENFSDGTRWELLGNRYRSLPYQFFGGDSDLYFLDNDIKSEAAGAKTSLALNFSYLDSKQTANALVKGPVKINQKADFISTFDSFSDTPDASASRNLSITSNTNNQSVDWVGNKTATTPSIGLFNWLYKQLGASESGNGVGASVFLNNITNTSTALIETGADIYADKVSVKADSDVFAVNLGYAGGSGTASLGIAGLYMQNTIDSTTIALIQSGVTLVAGADDGDVSVERLSVVADNRVDLIVAAGAMGSAGKLGVGASAAVSDITKVTKALVGSEDNMTKAGSVVVNGDARIAADSGGLIIGTALSASLATGKVTPSGGEAPKTKNTPYGISAAGAFIFNTINSTTAAGILNLSSFNAQNLSLKATESSGVFAFPITFASARANKVALAAAGIGLMNDAAFTVSSGIANVGSVNLTTLDVLAKNDSIVITSSVAASIAGIAEFSVESNSSSIALTGNVSVNNVTADIDAYLIDVDDLTVTGKNGSDVAVSIEAKDESEVYAVALGVAYAGNGAVSATIAENNINSDIDALISGTDLTVETGKIKHQAKSEADMVSVALGASFAKDSKPDFETEVGIAVGAAISNNMVRMNTRARVMSDSVITLPARHLDDARLDIVADNETDITAVVVGAAIGSQTGADTTVTLTGSGAEANNQVYGDTEALVDGSIIKQATSNQDASDEAIGVFLDADVDGSVTGVVVAANLAYASATTGAGVVGAIGVSLAENTIGGDPDNGDNANSLRAVINNSDIDITGEVSTNAESTQNISSVITAASVAVAKSESGIGAGLSGVGADAKNTVKVDIESGVKANADGHTLLADKLTIDAKDDSDILSTVVGATIAGAYSGTSSTGTLSIGVSLAKNEVNTNTKAIIDNVDAGSSSRKTGSVSLSASSDAEITATSVSASLSASYSSASGGSLALSGGGAYAGNTIGGSTEALVESSDLFSNGDVSIKATNKSDIDATTVAVSSAVAADSSSGSAGISIGAAITENTIGTSDDRLKVKALLEDSALTIDGDLNIDATNDMTVDAEVGAGSAAVVVSTNGSGLAGSGSGVGATNKIYGETLAWIDNGRDVNAGKITVNAINSASITSVAASASLAFGLAPSGGSVSLAVAASVAENTIDSIAGAKATGQNTGRSKFLSESLAVNTIDTSTIDAQVVGVSLGAAVGESFGGTLTVGAVEATNTVANQIYANVEYLDIQARNGGVTVGSHESTTVNLKAEAASVAIAGGKVGVSLAGAGVKGTNTINNSSQALISDSKITLVPRSDYAGSSLTDELLESDLVEFADGVYRYIGSDLDLSPDFESDGYKYDENGSRVGVAQTSVESGEQFYFIDGTYRNNGATELSLEKAIAVAAALRAEALAAEAGRYESLASTAQSNADAAQNLANDKTKADQLAALADTAVEASLNASTSNAVAKAEASELAVAAWQAELENVVKLQETADQLQEEADVWNAISTSARSAADDAQSLAESTAAEAGLDAAGVSALKPDWALLDLDEVKRTTPADWELVYANADYGDQDVSVTAVNHAAITSVVGAASGSVGAGKGGAAAAIGVTLSENTIGSNHITSAYIEDSQITSLNDIVVDAQSLSTIDSTVYGAGVAVAAGKFAIAGAGVGIDLDNTIGGSTSAYVNNSAMVAGNDISITADADGQVVKADAVAAAISAAIGLGGSFSISATDIDNTMAMAVNAWLNVDDSQSITNQDYRVFAGNDIEVASHANALMTNVDATAVTFSAGLAGASGGGVDITNLVNNQVNAILSGSDNSSAVIGSMGDINLKASEATDLSINVTNVALSASIGGALGIALVRNDVRSSISSKVKNTSLEARNIYIDALADNNIHKTQAFGFAAALAAASANRADVDITTTVSAVTESAKLTAVDDIVINANATNYARADASGGAVGAVAAGAMIADIEQGNDGSDDVLVEIGDGSQLGAASITVKASGNDDLLPETIAASGGYVAGAGAESNVTSYQAVVANIGKGVVIEADQFDLSSTLDQTVDASADAFTVALASGAGAGLNIIINSYADVNIGASTGLPGSGNPSSITAHDISINALNRFDKSRFSNGKSLRTGSGNIVGVNVMVSQTILNNHARINLTDDVQLVAEGSYDDKASLRIEARNDITTVDSITLETVSAVGGINAATSKVEANSDARVNIDGAVIENVTGKVFVTAKTDSENRASADILAVSGLSSAATGVAIATTNARNNVSIANVTMKAGDIYLYAGKSSQGVLNILESSANVELTSVSTSANVAVPVPDADITETNTITLGNNADIKSMTDITIEAREGIGGSERAKESGLTLSISGVPYGVDIDREGSVTSNNQFSVADSAKVTAGVNNKSFLQIRPVAEIQSILDDSSKVSADGVINIDALTDDDKKLLFGVDNAQGEVVIPELPEDVVYVMEELALSTINFLVTQDTVIEHNGSYYQYTPQNSAEIDLQQENYSNKNRWTRLNLTLAQIESLGYPIYESSITDALASAMTGEFFVVKPRELDSPTLTFTNLSTLLFEQKAQVESWIRDHSTNAEAIARYQVQLEEINKKIDELGLSDYVHTVDAGQIVKAPDGNYYQSKIKQESILELADYSDTPLWQKTNSTSGAWDYTDTARATSKVYNQALDILMVDLPDVYAAPGSVYLQIDGKSAESLAAQNNIDNLYAREGATIQIVNSTPFALRVNDAIVQDSQRVEMVGGSLKTYTPGAVQINYKDVNSIAIRGGTQSTDDQGVNSDSLNEIIIYQDRDPQFIKDTYGNFTLPEIPQGMYIQGNVVNENGGAYINNREGSIEVSTQIRAETVNVFAAGDFSLNSDAWFHTNKDPRQYINYQLMRNLVYNQAGSANTYFSGMGVDEADNSLEYALFSKYYDTLTLNATTADNSQILSMGKITLTARYLNINGLVQSGVNTVYLKIDENFNGGNKNVDLTNKKGQAISGVSFDNPKDSTNIKVPVDGYWDAVRQAIIIEDIVPAGGEVVISGQIISTGNGRIVAASGYAAVDIINDSGYELVMNDIDNRHYREGKITIIDSKKLTKDEYQYKGDQATHAHYQGTLVEATSTDIARIDYVQVGNTRSDVTFNYSTITFSIEKDMVIEHENIHYLYISEDDRFIDLKQEDYSDSSFWKFLGKDISGTDEETYPTYSSSGFTDGARYVWTEGQSKTSTTVRKYEKKSFNLFGGNTNFDDWLAKDNSYKWKTVEFTDKKPLLESESVLLFGDDNYSDSSYEITYVQTSGDSSVNSYDRETWTTGGGWLRKKTVHTKITVVEGLKDYYTHSLKADYDIAIDFLSGNSQPDVNISSKGDITLAGKIKMADEGTLSILSTHGAITMSDGVYALTSQADIEAKGTVRVILEGNTIGKGHRVVSNTGSVYLGVVQDDNPGEGKTSSNKLYIDEISARHTVEINAGGGIFKANGGETVSISANVIELLSLGGDIRLLTIDSAGDDIRPLTIDSATRNDAGYITVEAQGNVALTEHAGDMNVNQIIAAKVDGGGSSPYGVQLTTKSGDILDGNDDEVRASSLDTSAAQQFYAESQVTNEADAVTELYHQYWNILRDNGSVDYLSDVTAYDKYNDLFEQLSGDELAEVQSRIVTLNNSLSVASEYDMSFDQLVVWIATDVSSAAGTISEFESRIQEKVNTNRPVFESILSPGIVAKLYPDTPIIGGAGNTGSAEAANIQALVSGSAIILNAYGGLGQTGDRITIDMSGGVVALEESEKEVLAQATGSDVVATDYVFYVYTGTAGDISQLDINYNDGNWTEISSLDASANGFTSVTYGDYVQVDQDGVPVLYQYTGTSDSIELTRENFDDAGSPWQLVSVTSVAPASVFNLNSGDLVMQLNSVTIQLWDDLNLQGNVNLTAQATEGIAIEHSGALSVDRIVGASWVRLNVAGALIDSGEHNTAALVSAGDLVLITKGNILSQSDGGFRVQVAESAKLSVDTVGSVDIWQIEGNVSIGGKNTSIGDLYLDDVAATGDLTFTAGLLSSFTPTTSGAGQADIVVEKISTTAGKVTLQAAGDILDAYDDANSAIINIRAQDLMLVAGGGIGSRQNQIDNYLDLKLTGDVSANTRSDVYLNAIESSLSVGQITSDANVMLKSAQSILDGDQDNNNDLISLTGDSDITASSIFLEAARGTIGQLGNQVEIDTTGGQLTSLSGKSSYLREVRGDLSIASLVADSDSSGRGDANIYLTADGRVLNGTASGDTITASGLRIVAGQGIGAAGDALRTLIDHLEAKVLVGSLILNNTGALMVGGVSDEMEGLLVQGSIELVAQSPLTINEDVIASAGDITLTAMDSLATGDDLTVNAVEIDAELGNLILNAGDKFLLNLDGQLNAAQTLTLNTDLGSVDSESGDIKLYGSLNAATILVNTGLGDDSVMFDVQDIDGDVDVNTGAGNDLLTINQLVSRSAENAFVLDGEGGTDTYTIYRTGNNADYVVDVRDSGSEADGADTLTINGTSEADTFLLRANFVAAMHTDSQGEYTSTVERINYDRNINARLTLNGLDGNDSFFSDDNSTITTLDGGAGNDRFQIGQLFGLDRNTAEGTVAAGDEIATTETTLGFLSKGNSLPMVVYGGDGKDEIKVYSNKGITKLYGEDGDDSFVVRAFLKKNTLQTAGGGDVELFGGDGADDIQYSINSPLKIDGGNGTDSVVVLGTEGDDNFMITENGIFGAGLNISFDGVELAEVDGLEGDDTFYVLSTSDDVETTIIGGLGADTFNIASDVTKPIVSYSVEGRSSFVNHSVFSDDLSYNDIFVEGISLNVASKENGAIGVDRDDGEVVVSEGGVTDFYELQLNAPKPSDATIAYVTVSAARASGSDKDKTNGLADSVLISLDGQTFSESLVIDYDSETNWDDATRIYIKAVDDQAAEGQREYVISHSVRSDNPDFDQLDIDNVEVVVNDNDMGGMIVSPFSNLTVVEGGSEITFDVRLATTPEIGQVVTVSLAEIIPSDWSSQLTLSTDTLTFDHTNWSGQFTVIATDDGSVENLYRAGITLSASGNYAAESVSLDIGVVDNDSGSVLITQTDGSTLVSATQQDAYQIALSKQPAAPVTVNLLNDGQVLFSSADPRFDASTNSVTFGIDDWNSPIELTLAANTGFQPETDSQPVQNPPLQPHTLSDIRGKLIIEGGTPDGKKRELTRAVMLPTEIDGPLPLVNIELNEDEQTDTLNVFNDGSIQNDSGMLTEDTITGLGMTSGKGIEYHDIEVLEVLLGSGDDGFIIENTASNVITVVHGGGGNDTLTVNDSASDGALILLGDSVQNGSTYNATSNQKTEKAREYTNPGNDVINASGAGASVVIYGGQGNDTLTGSQYSDHIAGGSGNDRVYGLDGDDHIYGDSGFNLDVATRLDLSTQILTVANDADLLNDNLDTADQLTVGSDTIDGGEGNDIILSDKGKIVQQLDTNRILTTGLVISIHGAQRDQGGDDIVDGNAGDDVVIAGFGNDTIRGGTDNDILLGDSGQLNYVDGDTDLTTLDSVMTIDADLGGDDHISGQSGDDIIFGGAGSDSLFGDGSVNRLAIIDESDNDIIIGDLGAIALVSNRAVRIYSTDTNVGDSDTIQGNEDNDIIIAGAGGDGVKGNQGNDWILADFGEVDLRNGQQVLSTASGDSHSTGDDIVDAGEGENRILGGLGDDQITAGTGADDVLGDNGSLTYTETGVAITIISTDTTLGGRDTIQAGDGDNRILGGFGNDELTAGDGNDTVIGDNGQVNFVGGIRNEVFSTDISNSTGGNDIINLGNGSDQAIGGVGNDQMNNTSGETIMVGDDGRIVNDSEGRYLTVRTGSTTIGGNDRIAGGLNRDIMMGGFGDDLLDGQAGDDLMGGDGTQVTRSPSTIVIEAVDLFTGGVDTLIGGSGLDRMQGHFGGDFFDGDFSEDVMIGEYGRFTFNANTEAQQATFVVSLAQNGLDLIRGQQTNLFSNFAQQFFAESGLGQVARARALETPLFTEDAQEAFARLTPTSQQRTLASSEVTATEIEAEQQEVLVEEVPVNEQQVPEEELVPVEGEPTVEPTCEVIGDDPEGFCKPMGVTQVPENHSSDVSDTALEHQSSGIDLKAVLAGFSAWAIVRPVRKQRIR